MIRLHMVLTLIIVLIGFCSAVFMREHGAEETTATEIIRQPKNTELFSKAVVILRQVNWATLASTLVANLANHLSTIWSGIQYVAVIYSVAYLVFTFAAWFFPSLNVLPVSLGLPPATTIFRSLKSNIAGMDIGKMMRTLESVNVMEPSFQYLEIGEPECQSLAVCELGEYMVNNYPGVSSFLGLSASLVPRLEQYSSALLNGVNYPNCQKIYPGCPYSPREKLELL